MIEPMRREEYCLGESLRSFNEEDFLKKCKEEAKEFIQRTELRKKKKSLRKRAMDEVRNELGITEISKDSVSEEDYLETVKTITDLYSRNLKIIEKVIDRDFFNRDGYRDVKGSYVSEFLNNEKCIYTLLDRISAINSGVETLDNYRKFSEKESER